MEDKITEKVYCYDHPSAYKDDNTALIAALMNRESPAEAMALMNQGNGMWNNPFVYLVWMMFAGRFFNNGGWGDGSGQGAQNIEMQNQLQAIRSQLSDNQNSNLIMDAIKGNANAIGMLASNLNCDFNAINGAICDVRAAVDKVAGSIGFNAERVINAVNMGDCSVIQAIKDCCCSTQKAIIEMGYQNQLANCNQTNTIMTAINGVNTGVERGFSTVAYETQKQTCDIINAGNANTQRIIDVLNNHWNQEQALALQDSKFRISQMEQNQYLLSQLKGNCGCNNCGC